MVKHKKKLKKVAPPPSALSFRSFSPSASSLPSTSCKGTSGKSRKKAEISKGKEKSRTRRRKNIPKAVQEEIKVKLSLITSNYTDFNLYLNIQ